MFVMLNVWRKSNRRLSVTERLQRTYESSAVSITISSLTDSAVFAVGISSKFPAVRIFCLYCCVSIISVYLFQLTFFGACMALTGYREAAGRHSISFRKVKHSGKLVFLILYKMFLAQHFFYYFVF